MRAWLETLSTYHEHLASNSFQVCIRHLLSYSIIIFFFWKINKRPFITSEPNTQFREFMRSVLMPQPPGKTTMCACQTKTKKTTNLFLHNASKQSVQASQFQHTVASSNKDVTITLENLQPTKVVNGVLRYRGTVPCCRLSLRLALLGTPSHRCSVADYCTTGCGGWRHRRTTCCTESSRSTRSTRRPLINTDDRKTAAKNQAKSPR